jgi:hypothetical protein
MIRSASGPSIRGKLIKGNNFDGEKLINLKKIKPQTARRRTANICIEPNCRTYCKCPK